MVPRSVRGSPVKLKRAILVIVKVKQYWPPIKSKPFLSMGQHQECVFWYRLSKYWKGLKDLSRGLSSNPALMIFHVELLSPGFLSEDKRLHSCQLEAWRQPWVHPEGLFSSCCSSNQVFVKVEGLLCHYSHNHYHHNYNYCNNYNQSNHWWFVFSIKPACLCLFSDPLLQRRGHWDNIFKEEP